MTPDGPTPDGPSHGQTHGQTHGRIHRHGSARFTALTSRLVRLEYDPDGEFVDEPTQVIVRRDLDDVSWRVRPVGDGVELSTDQLRIRYAGGAFTAHSLVVEVVGNVDGEFRSRWRPGDPQLDPRGYLANLGGTARTLDGVDGEIPLEPGLLSATGIAVLDDSASLVVADSNRAPIPRHGSAVDLYVFGHGRDYVGALRDWFAAAGPSPLLPRWALGNWWSRYHRYTEAEYVALMDRFAAEGIPFSVAVVDMDWHLVDVDPEVGSGWTGYTWNHDLFPDPARFLAALHDRGLKVSLNVHPADGIRRHEAAYPAMCAALGRDPATGEPVAFALEDDDFARAYFEVVHHPMEDDGVDFWWIDWQQGQSSSIPGLDPLWLLNARHYADSARRGERPMTFSRYAGPGSHRFPVGFSGDTVTTWASLDFQPFFTATAANIGYFWWSHDIGGHFFGDKCDERTARWVQLGAFSPVNRLHSTSDPFNSKEPWRFGVRGRAVMIEFLRLRNRLVPYLYTAMWRAHTHGVGPVRPVYHDHPDGSEAYQHPNEFLFGPDLLVAPITEPGDPIADLATTTAWLPPGIWWDFFTGRRYAGGRTLRVHRRLESMPVFARAGAIIPLAEDPMAPAGQTPAALRLKVFPGAEGEAVLDEDDGSATVTVRERHRTALSYREDDDGALVLTWSVEGPATTGSRRLLVEFVGATDLAGLEVVVAGAPRSAVVTGSVVDLGDVGLDQSGHVRVAASRPAGRGFVEEVFDVLDRAQIDYVTKNLVHDAALVLRGAQFIAALDTVNLPPLLRGALVELASCEFSPGPGPRATR